MDAEGGIGGPVRGERIADVVARRLAQAILSGQLPPGSRLREETLASNFSVSRTPIREALIVLAASGLAHLEPNRGATVLQLTADDVAEVYHLRAVLALGRGGRKGREFPNDTCYSHFDVVYQYPNNVDVSFSSTQFGKAQFDVNERFFGTRGSSSSPYSGPLGIWGEEKWLWGGGADKPAADGQFSASGSFSDNLAQADSEKQGAFISSISSGKFHNQAALGVESALTAMLGRQVAYENRELTWDELLRSKEKLDPGIDVNKLG